MADLGSIGRPPGGAKATTVVLYGGYISGQVTDASGNPVRHPVRAFHSKTGEFSGGTWSSPTTGNYVIRTGIKYQQTAHFVIEQDPTLTNNARIFDNVTPLL